MRHRVLMLSATVAGLAAWTVVPSRAAGTPDLDALTALQAATDLCTSK